MINNPDGRAQITPRDDIPSIKAQLNKSTKFMHPINSRDLDDIGSQAYLDTMKRLK